MVFIALFLVAFVALVSWWFINSLDLSIITEREYAAVLVNNVKGIAIGGGLIFLIGIITHQLEATVYGFVVVAAFGSVFYVLRNIK